MIHKSAFNLPTNIHSHFYKHLACFHLLTISSTKPSSKRSFICSKTILNNTQAPLHGTIFWAFASSLRLLLLLWRCKNEICPVKPFRTMIYLLCAVLLLIYVSVVFIHWLHHYVLLKKERETVNFCRRDKLSRFNGLSFIATIPLMMSNEFKLFKWLFNWLSLSLLLNLIFVSVFSYLALTNFLIIWQDVNVR